MSLSAKHIPPHRQQEIIDEVTAENAYLKHQLNLKEFALMGSQDRVKELERQLAAEQSGG